MNSEVLYIAKIENSDNENNQMLFENKNAKCVFADFGKLSTVYIAFDYETSASVNIRLSYGPMADCLKFEKTVTLIPESNLFKDNEYICCRYIKIEISDNSNNLNSVNIKRLKFYSSQYSLKTKGKFHCNDETLNRIFNIGVYTDALSVQQNEQALLTHNNKLSEWSLNFRKNWKGSSGNNFVFFDGPRRDREAWLGDIRTEALTGYVSLGWNEVAKNSLELFENLQTEEGYTYGSGTTCQKFLEYNLWWVIAVWEYYLYTGDEDYLKKMYPKMLRLLDYILGLTNEKHFLKGDSCWMWTFPREGYSSALQCILYKAFVSASKMSETFNDSANKEKFVEFSLALKENINKYFWNEEKGIYNEVVGFKNIPAPVFQDTNSYAVSFDIADSYKKSRVLDYLKDNMWTDFGSTTIDKEVTNAELSDDLKTYPLKKLIENGGDVKKNIESAIYPHNKQVWPFMNGYEVQAWFVSGREEEAFELIKRCWGNKAYSETNTFWEMFDIKTKSFAARKISEFGDGDTYNSECHGWSGWVSYLMQTYILGVMPITAGYKKTVINPMPNDLTELSGRVPTPYGYITVDMKCTDDVWYVTIEHPKSIEVVFKTDSKAFKNKKIKTEFKINQ